MVSWKLVRRMLGHTGGVLDVSIGQKYIASSSKDCTIRIWDRDTGETLRILREHNGAVNALGLKGDRLISAGGDSCLKFAPLPFKMLHIVSDSRAWWIGSGMSQRAKLFETLWVMKEVLPVLHGMAIDVSREATIAPFAFGTWTLVIASMSSAGTTSSFGV